MQLRPAACLSALLLVGRVVVEAFYLPGVAPQSFKEGDP